VKLKVWGARGSIPAPGARTARYGGNTSCCALTLSDETLIVLDAGSGIRELGLELSQDLREVHILLTHLHLDHIQGLLFFSPLFRPDVEVVIWGPEAPRGSLRDRIGRYLSAPLSPVEIRGLPARVEFRSCPGGEWTLGSARIRAAPVNHRGPTLGFRITEGEASLCYIPDHEPALGMPLERTQNDWISGFELACRASLLLHDCQYTDDEYPRHVGWGHSGLSDALMFAKRTEVAQMRLFHHDPLHDDSQLDRMHESARAGWAALGGAETELDMAVEGGEISLDPDSGVAQAA